MSLTFALVGNQNCGKSTLFNYLTGSNQHVGNFPGVTVQKKEGRLLTNKDVTVIDLPGIYSLSPYTSEEIVTRDLLLRSKPDIIINVIDATNIERSLYLSLQLIELNTPMIMALNMMDELTASGGSIDIKKIEDRLTVPVVPITANSGAGVDELLSRAQKTAHDKKMPERLDFCSGVTHMAIHSIAHLIEAKVRSKGLPLRFSATKLIEGDEPLVKELELTANELDIIDHVTKDLEIALDTDKEAALADMRYTYIEELCSYAVHKPQETIAQIRSVKIDHYLTHKYFAIPIFLLTIFTIFWLTFDVIGAALSDWLEIGISSVTEAADLGLTAIGLSAPIHSLIIDGIFTGVGSVLSFLPTIVTLFFFLSMLEDSGYMARIAFVMDKLPIYGVFISAFFADNKAAVMMFLYLLGIFIAIASGLLLKTFVYNGQPVPFVMELPAYRLPTARNIMLHMWSKAKDFLYKAFTVIFVASIVIWLLQSFDTRFYMVDNPENSMLAGIGSFIAPFFAPLGFGDWRAATALVTGLTAKEVVISTLSVLMGGDGDIPGTALQSIFTPLTALSFLTFSLLYPPCIAALAAIRREMNSTTETFYIMSYQIITSWIVAFIVYNLGKILGFK